MFGSHRFLFIIGQDPGKWADRWGLRPLTAPCSECGTELVTTRPFFIGDFRGLHAPTCKCGNVNTPYCLVRDPWKGDLFTVY